MDGNVFKDVRLIAFDADDTLWDCQQHFEAVERRYCELLSGYGSPQVVADALLRTETSNMPLLGYGSKAFTLSLVENAIALSRGRVAAEVIGRVISLGKTLLNLPATPLAGVRETLAQLRQAHIYNMVVFTKGDTLEQEGKYDRSGLAELFDDIIVVADKTRREYERLCALFDTDTSRLLMVGNSFRSDIEPVLQLGGYAIHTPYVTEWKHETTETYAHPHLRTVRSFSEIAGMVLSGK